MRVDVTKEGKLPSHFTFTCQGESDNSTKLLMRKGKVNKPVKDICQNVPVKVAYYQGMHWFMVDNGAMVGYVWIRVGSKLYWYHESLSIHYGRAYPHEMLSTFFLAHNLSPTFLDASQDWGWADGSNGAYGLVSRIFLG